MRFVHPQFLFGLIGAMVPILIYFFTRQRVKQVEFSTLRFFAGVSRTLVRRKKIHEMILLAMRVIACALLAMAFSRPFFAPKDPREAGMVHADVGRVIVADLSGSMARGDGPVALRKLAQEAVAEMKGNAAVGMVGFDLTPTVLVAPTKDLGAAAKSAGELTPGEGGTDLAAAIKKADELLQNVKSPKKEIVCISDLHRSAWERFSGDWKLSPGVKLVIKPVTIRAAGSVRIIAADCPQSVVADPSPRMISVKLANSSADQVKTPVKLVLGEKEIETREVAIPAGGQAAVRFRQVFAKPGDNPGKIIVGDQSEGRFYFNVRVIPKIRILILNGPTANSQGLFFLKMALAPAEDSPFLVATSPAGSATLAQIEQASVVILADVPSVPTAIHSALANVLNRGGGLLMMPGKGVQAEAFNNGLGQLAPAKLRRIMPASEGRREGSKAIIAKVDNEHPVFEMFQKPHYGDFSAVTFDQYWEVTDSQLCRVSLRLDDGRPMLLERPVGAGISMLMASPIDPAWNNLPKRAIFLPYLHQVMRYLSLRTERQTAWSVGQTLPVGVEFSLRDPAGQLQKQETWTARQSGFHTLIDKDGKDAFIYAVNPDPAEAQTATVDPRQIVAALEREAGASENAGAASASLGLFGKEIWAWVTGMLVILALGELFVANRTMEQ